MKAVQFGDPAARDDIAMGPLINAAARDQVARKVAKAVAQGARVALGGEPQEGKGYFYPPTLLLDVRQNWILSMRKPSGRCCRWWRFRRSMKRWRW